MRASIAAEAAGVPSVSIVCEGFEGQAAATGRGLGFDGMALASTVGHVDTQSRELMIDTFATKTVDQVVAGLTREPPRSRGVTAEPSAVETVASGTIDEIHAAFIERGWSDGSPIVPPTCSRIEAFLAPGGHDPWKVLGVAPSSGRDLTIWSIAVNAVMAGCRPEHLPVLIAIAEVLADPHYGVEHSGNTTGADALVILDGPASAGLGFNHGVGALREGTSANTSVGRWLRLYLRNVFGFTTDEHDKGTFGNSARVVLAEDMDALAELGWAPVSAQFDVDAAADAVTVARMNSGAIIGSVFGSSPEEILPYLGDGLARISGWDLTHVYGLGIAQFRPLLVLSPMLARVFGDAGWTKADVQAALFEHARIPAWRFEKLIGEWSNLTAGRRTLEQLHAEGHVPAAFAASDDPERPVPIVTSPDRFVIAVAGDPTRANAYVMSNDGPHGDWTARAIEFGPSNDLVCEVPSA
ncbi:MAG: UGSC family (seleno)protein [Actinomycetota bacterium]